MARPLVAVNSDRYDNVPATWSNRIKQVVDTKNTEDFPALGAAAGNAPRRRAPSSAASKPNIVVVANVVCF